MNLSVIQTENLDNDQASLGCYISVNGSLLDIITPINSNNQENITEIPDSGAIEFTIKDMRKDRILGVFSSDIQALPTEGSHWFHLSPFPDSKILISFNNFIKTSRQPENFSNDQDFLSKISELQTSVIELEYQLCFEKEERKKDSESKKKLIESIRASSEMTIEQFSIKLKNAFSIIAEINEEKTRLISLCEAENQQGVVYNEKIKELMAKCESITSKNKIAEMTHFKQTSELQEELRKTKHELYIACCKNNALENQVSQLTYKLGSFDASGNQDLVKKIERITEQLKSSEKREELLAKQIEILESQQFLCEKCSDSISELMLANEKAEKYKVLALESRPHESLLQDLQEKTIFQASEIDYFTSELSQKNDIIAKLSKSLNLYDELDKTLETNIDSLTQENSEIIQECAGLKQRILNLTKTNENLEREITELRCKYITEKKLEKIRLDEIDFCIESYMFDQGIENSFVKMARGIYLYGSKRVKISLTSENRLICWIGGTYMPIDQFLKNYQSIETEDLSKYLKKQPLSLSQVNSPNNKVQTKPSLSNTPKNSYRKPSPRQNFTDRKFDDKFIEKLRFLCPLKEKNFFSAPHKKN